MLRLEEHLTTVASHTKMQGGGEQVSSTAMEHDETYPCTSRQAFPRRRLRQAKPAWVERVGPAQTNPTIIRDTTRGMFQDGLRPRHDDAAVSEGDFSDPYLSPKQPSTPWCASRTGDSTSKRALLLINPTTYSGTGTRIRTGEEEPSLPEGQRRVRARFTTATSSRRTDRLRAGR